MDSSQGDCIFCRLAKGEIPTAAVYEDEEVFGFADINPQAPHHYLLIPKTHIPRLNDLDEAHKALIGSLVLAATKVAGEKGIAESGYRLVLNCNADAGQEVFHIHLHLLGGRKMSWPPG